METHKIKPLLNHTLSIQNKARYNDFLIKRPKTILSFKFLKTPDFILSEEDERRIQTKLHKALKLLKSIRKLDLSEFGVKEKSISQAKSLSIFKAVSKAKSIFVNRVVRADNLTKDSSENCLRYLPRILHLDWGLNTLSKKRDILRAVQNQNDIINPLKYLKYCPKIRSLKINPSEQLDVFLQEALKIKRLPPSLKFLDAKSRLKEDQLNLSSKNLQSLKSLNFSIDHSWSLTAAQNTMKSLSKLTYLQEIDLQFLKFMPPGLDSALAEISQKRILKKAQLEFDFEMSNSQEIFQALKPCPLTYFSLKTFYIQDHELLLVISDFLKAMNLLETLKLKIHSPSSFKDPELLEPICEQISQLQRLYHLELSFKADWSNDSYPEITHYIPNLPKGLKTFSFECSEISLFQALDPLIAQLQGSYHSLENLNIFFENNSLFDQGESKILAFIAKLQNNIQELRLPCLKVTSLKFINNLADTVKTLRYLKTLQLGRIEHKQNLTGFSNALKEIFEKRGLKDFSCVVEARFLDQLIALNRQEDPIISVKKILKSNPFFENAYFSDFLFNRDQNW